MILLRLGAVAVLITTIATTTSCSKSGGQPARAHAEGVRSAGFVLFEDDAGLDFVHQVERSEAFRICEVNGAGLAVFDADGDGDLDLLCLDCGRYPCGAPNRLYLRDANGRYVLADGGPGLAEPDFSEGVALGDVDNDGDLDLFIANVGPDRLLINDGKGRFEALPAELSGIGDPGYSTSASFFDYDLDGLLDLYVCRYVAIDDRKTCTGIDGRRDYCHPAVYAPLPDLLYHNLGGGRFENVSEKLGISALASYGLGVVCLDVDDDGDQDVYVANDSRPNFLWLNDGGRGFEEAALVNGLAVNGQGMPEASMGLAVGDVDGNGLVDLFVTHLRAESNTLYLRQPGGFVDGTARARLSAASLPATGFGTVLFDMDNDLDLDLVVANGSVGRLERALPGATKGSPWEFYAEPNHLYRNQDGLFSMEPELGGDFCADVQPSRAMVAADLDQDGGLDLVVGNLGGPTRLYRNRLPVGRYLKFRVLDDHGRDAIGATVTIRVGEGRLQRRVAFDGSYLAALAEPVHFGLGEADRADQVVVVWPGGERQDFGPAEAGRVHVLRRAQR
ncbi:MAG: CRTAC1 family protein [Planctomycetes bacterium]|nr:CRTAC1 family protein [Planctomycetota bacterium]